MFTCSHCVSASNLIKMVWKTKQIQESNRKPFQHKFGAKILITSASVIWNAVLSVTYRGSLVPKFLWQQWRQQWLHKFHIWLTFPSQFPLYASVSVAAALATRLQVFNASAEIFHPQNKKNDPFHGQFCLVLLASHFQALTHTLQLILFSLTHSLEIRSRNVFIIIWNEYLLWWLWPK